MSAPPVPDGPDPRWFQRLVERSQDILTVLDGDGRILYDSPAVARILGYAQGELVGRNAFALLHPHDLAVARDLLVETIANPGRVSVLSLRFRHRDGGWRRLESVGTRLDAEGQDTAVVVSSREIAGRSPAPAAPADAPDPPSQEAELEMLERLARAAELRDDETGRHIRRVGDLAAAVADRLGLPPGEVETVRRAAPLHDIGKIGIPDAILRKRGSLSPAELEVMRTHTLLGAQLLAGGRSHLVRTAEQIALSHHERWDGGGYPGRLRGESIPLPARIVAVCDCYDALTHSRPYRGPLPAPLALREIRSGLGSHFDPAVAEVFLALLEPAHPAPDPIVPPPEPPGGPA